MLHLKQLNFLGVFHSQSAQPRVKFGQPLEHAFVKFSLELFHFGILIEVICVMQVLLRIYPGLERVLQIRLALLAHRFAWFGVFMDIFLLSFFVAIVQVLVFLVVCFKTVIIVGTLLEVQLNRHPGIIVGLVFTVDSCVVFLA